MNDYLMNPLTDVEQSELAQYEQTIRQGLNTFFDVGIALGQIREKRLYRDHHDTFEEYCQERWEMSKTHANRYIASANTMKALKEPPAQMTIDEMTPGAATVDAATTGAVTPIGVSPTDKTPSDDAPSDDVPIDILPQNESQVRPLTKLEPEQQRTAWSQVVQAVKAGAKLTAALVEEVVNRILAPKEPEDQEPEPQTEQEPISDEQVTDERQIDIEDAISQVQDGQAEADNTEPEESEPDESQIAPPTLQADTETPDTEAIETNEGERDWGKDEILPEGEPEPTKPEAAAILDALEQDRGWVNQIVKQFADSKYWPYDTTDHKLFREVTIRKPTGAKNRWGEDALKRYRLDAVAVIRINAHRYNPIIVGIEVKVDKHDLRNDAKMQEYLDYVDCFYLVTPRTLAVEKFDYRMNHPQKDHIGDLIVEAGQVELHQIAEPLTPNASARQELATELLMKDLWKEAEQVHQQRQTDLQKQADLQPSEPLTQEQDLETVIIYKNPESEQAPNERVPFGIFINSMSDDDLSLVIKLAKRELTRRNRPHQEGDQTILKGCSSCEFHRSHGNKLKGVKIPNEFGKCIREGGLCEAKANQTEQETPVEVEEPTKTEEEETVLGWHSQGWSVRKIADWCHISKSKVDRIIQKYKEEAAQC